MRPWAAGTWCCSGCGRGSGAELLDVQDAFQCPGDVRGSRTLVVPNRFSGLPTIRHVGATEDAWARTSLCLRFEWIVARSAGRPAGPDHSGSAFRMESRDDPSGATCWVMITQTSSRSMAKYSWTATLRNAMI